LHVLEEPVRLSSQKAKKRLLIFGSGNVANEIGDYVSEENDGTFDTIFSTYRINNDNDDDNNNNNGNNNDAPPSSKNGVQFINFDHASNLVSDCTHILITIPPSIKESSATPSSSPSWGLCKFHDPVSDNLEIMRSIPKDVTIGYVSTTGVYGNHNNSFVDESSSILCKLGTKALAYHEIEQRWQQLQTNDHDHDTNRNVFIFRCAGLYGNNFSALHTVRNRGIPTPTSSTTSIPMKINEDEGYTSRVHLKDVARAIVATMKRTDLKGGICNLSDSSPAPRSEVMNYASELLSNSNISMNVVGREEDDLTIAGSSERRKRRNKDRKRVSNDAMKNVLKDKGGLLFPTYREGLQEILANNIDQWRASG